MLLLFHAEIRLDNPISTPSPRLREVTEVEKPDMDPAHNGAGGYRAVAWAPDDSAVLMWHDVNGLEQDGVQQVASHLL